MQACGIFRCLHVTLLLLAEKLLCPGKSHLKCTECRLLLTHLGMEKKTGKKPKLMAISQNSGELNVSSLATH